MKLSAPLRTLTRRLQAANSALGMTESTMGRTRTSQPSFSSAAMIPHSVWSHQMSFASPEADFTMMSPLTDTRSFFSTQIWTNTLSYATPESDFSFVGSLPQENATTHLPKTFAEALQDKDQAIVVTTASSPHRIVHVNQAWEDLCGFQKTEVLDQSLNVIQGPDSNAALASHTVKTVLETKQPADAYLINYNKNGRRFTNHLSMGPLYLDGEMSFLVGVLQEVQPNQVPLRMAAV